MSFPVVVPSVRQSVLPAWIGPTFAAVVVQAALMAVYLARFGGDPSALVCVRQDAVGKFPFEYVRTSLSEEGFDGQFYYAIARDPWHKQDERAIVLPGYRHQRILYPALGWLLSGGDGKKLLWALPAVNLMAFGALAGLGAVFATRFGRNPWWGFFLPLMVNAGTPALRDLTDPLATLALFGLLATVICRGSGIALMVWAAAAAFSREQNVLVIGMIGASLLLQRRWLAVGALALVLAAWGGWLWRLREMYGYWPFAGDNLAAPFAGMWYRLQHLRGDEAARAAPIHAVGLIFILAQVGVCLIMPLWRAEKVVALTALAGAALAVCGGPAIYMSGHSYMRVFAMMPLGIWLWTVHSGRTWPALLLSPALLWPCYALFQVWRH